MYPQKTHRYPIYNYPDFFSNCFCRGEKSVSYPCPQYALIFVFSGELFIRNDHREVTVGKGQYVFLSKDVHTWLIRKVSPCGARFSGVFMGFGENFLYEFYHNMNNKCKMAEDAGKPASIIELSNNAYLDSLYISLFPYLQWNIEPIHQIVEIKLLEAVCSLLLTDEKFYLYLFDCLESMSALKPVSTRDCYEQNFCMKDSSKFGSSGFPSSHLGNNTGISGLQWAFTKKVEVDYIRLEEECEANIYMEANYTHVACWNLPGDKPYFHTRLN